MPSDTPIFRPQTAIEGVLIRRGQLERIRRAHKLERQARRHASQLLREAQNQADAIRSHAYSDGYQQGMLTALDQIAAALADSQALAERWRGHLEQQARAMLAAAVDHPDTLLLLLDEWLKSQPSAAPEATLYLRLPKTARPRQGALMSLLAERWHGVIQIDHHDDDRFIMRCADQAAEFSPEHYLEPASRQLLQSLNGLQQDCRQLSAAALEQLQRQLRQRLEPLAATLPATPSTEN
ncbi:hypothetical protein ACFFU8_04410 [Chromobacterium piscinae]|uniref:hypothetical protein n=1 Tax=Chromobacterium piscinae TaxID=686831 RepID=UPI001E4DEBFB|nr:hypothetical protein [Chromobacterium piscinae]MCD5326510.1 hypothetical protein [Chromobacterium piscinae]